VLLNKEADRTLVHSAVQCVIGQFNVGNSVGFTFLHNYEFRNYMKIY